MRAGLTKMWVLIICIALSGFAASRTNFSGSYTAQGKRDGKSNAATVLNVVHNESAVDVTRINGEISTTNRFPLDGTEGDYTTETGVRGKCRAQLKNDTLILETLVASPASPNRPTIRFQTIEVWQLSSDTNTLTIKSEIKSPDMPREVIAAAFPNNPSTERYRRTDSQ